MIDNKDTTPAKSIATQLIEIAEKRYEFGTGMTGEPFSIPRTGARVLQMLRSGRLSLRTELAREYFRLTGKAAPQQATADALAVIEGLAAEACPQPLHTRVGGHDGSLWLDMGDHTGRAIQVTAAGWDIAYEVPVLFRRTALTGALPDPMDGGSLHDLWDRLNVAEEDRPLIAAWLVAVLFDKIPHPVLMLGGEQGSGKSSAARALVSILDPGPVPLRKAPRDADSWITAAAGSWIVAIDNLSTVPDWLSDSICRACTGEGDVRRKLYTDGDMHVFSFRRCLILNGIDLGALRGDLADRLLPVDLEVIGEDKRRTDSAIWDDWEEVQPLILGAVLELAAGVLRRLSSVELERKPRMADFACILAAVDEELGTKGLTRYLERQGALATASLTADPFVAAIGDLGSFSGTAQELLMRLPPYERAPRGWPTTPRLATQILKRQAPVMRKAGWIITDDGGRNQAKVLKWSICAPELASKLDPPYPLARPNGHEPTGLAGMTGQKNGLSKHSFNS